MQFVFLFCLFAAGLGLIIHNNGGWTWILLWPILSCLLIAAAYTLASPRLFGKRPTGQLSWPTAIAFLPYILVNWILWNTVRRVHRLVSSAPCASQITPTLWVSRRLTPAELPPGVVCVVDMTCEFPATRGLVAKVPHYFCLPTLDYGYPSTEAALALIAQLRTIDGPRLIHCAQGHGRSALFAAAYLIATGAAQDPDGALRLLKLKRPNITLNPSQRIALNGLTDKLRAT